MYTCGMYTCGIQIFPTNISYEYFRRIFSDEFFQQIFPTNFSDEFFKQIFPTNFYANFFRWILQTNFSDKFFRQIFWTNFYLLTIASFRIGVPSILFAVHSTSLQNLPKKILGQKRNFWMVFYIKFSYVLLHYYFCLWNRKNWVKRIKNH